MLFNWIDYNIDYNIDISDCFIDNLKFGLVWFYGIPTIVGYLMPNPFL